MVEDICTHILMISKGEQQFFGTVAELKNKFSQHGTTATLEQIFFMATDVQSSDRQLAELVITA